MKPAKPVNYEFVNSQTGNVIGYLSLPVGLSEKVITEQLNKKRTELAIANTLPVDIIYWLEENHPIQ